MQIQDILHPELCQLGVQASSRKKALQLIANQLQLFEPELDAFTSLKSLVAREQLGTTAIGNGVALPHGRLENCKQAVAVLVTLEEGVDFGATDEELVDLIFCLIVPPEQDFQELGGIHQIIDIFNNKVLRAQMRNAHNSEALFSIMEDALSQCHQAKEDTNKQAIN